MYGTYTAPVTDASSEPVSLGKTGDTAGKPNGGGPADGKPTGGKPLPPRTILLAVIMLGISGISAIVSGIALYGQDAWLLRELTKHNPKPGKKNHLSASQLVDKVGQTQKTALIGAVIVVVAVGILGWAVFKGRYWSRWGVVGFWVLATFSGTVIGINSILAVGSDIPSSYKIPSFLAGATFAIAVILVNLRESTAYFALHRPPRPAGAPARRGGLLGGLMKPPPQRAQQQAATNVRTRPDADSAAERARTKKRANVANAESVAKGAELARSRAKASKSRRTDH